ncbi:acyl-CoA dehydrogenase family protein [Tepidiphilus margaritifer]|uniref:acyl-CoA dehydrogenase family protein n=1 Tax=Tepidiphilus margaritifer TaxID=203471 RepID=UPI00040EA0C4|nr:acyl-CoA dehydrogenase family protein [Tepidiphilus margaritifer]
MSETTRFSSSTLSWVAEHADALNEGGEPAKALVPALAQGGFFGIGVPSQWGGSGGTLLEAIEAIAALAQHSLTAAFVCWGQRTFIEYLLATPNTALRARWLEPVLTGRIAGATGLSNAMKYLSGIESLQLTARREKGALRLDGRLPWVTNLRREGFLVAAAASLDGGSAVVVFESSMPGVRRSDDLDLVALRGSNTAAIEIDGVTLNQEWLLHDEAHVFCSQVRPAFLGLQLGLPIGLARAALRSAQERAGAAHAVVLPAVAEAQRALDTAVAQLHKGLSQGLFQRDVASLFRLRIRLTELVQQALSLELAACGGRAYLRAQPCDFARRWLEAAFIPVITPSLTQLQGELARHAA